MRREIYAVFLVDGKQVGQTAGRTQPYIRTLAYAYAVAHIGKSVDIEYPTLRVITNPEKEARS